MGYFIATIEDNQLKLTRVGAEPQRAPAARSAFVLAERRDENPYPVTRILCKLNFLHAGTPRRGNK